MAGQKTPRVTRD